MSPPPKFQSSKNRCRCPYGGCLQPEKGVAPPCLTETPTTSNQPSSGNFGVKRGLGCWRGRKRFGMAGCPMKHRRSIQSSPGALLWANDFAAYRYKIRYSVGANACQVALGQSYHMRARNPGGQTSWVFSWKTHRASTVPPPSWRWWLSLGTVIPSGTFSSRRSDRDTAPFLSP